MQPYTREQLKDRTKECLSLNQELKSEVWNSEEDEMPEAVDLWDRIEKNDRIIWELAKRLGYRLPDWLKDFEYRSKPVMGEVDPIQVGEV